MTNLTHLDIYTKMMIEYDKANITSSYPSLTKYEVATILDKAYNALIALCITGNNPRKASFEQDVKAIEDIRPLIYNVKLSTNTTSSAIINNVKNLCTFNIPTNLKYYIQGTAIDPNNEHLNTRLSNHAIAEEYKLTSNDLPWIEKPIVYLNGQYIQMLVDPYKYSTNKNDYKLIVTYIKEPIKFVKTNCFVNDLTKFELNDTMAEQLINLAIIFATETVESPRLQSKTSINTLES